MKKSATLLLIAAIASSTGAHALEIKVVGSGTTSMDDNFNQLPFEMHEVTNPGGSKTISGSGHHENTNTIFGLISAASGSGSAFADAGLLRAKVDGLALIGPGAPNVPTITHGTPRVNALFGASFVDSVEIKSATLPIGSPATYRATIHLDVETNRPGHVGPTFAGFDSGTFFFNYFVGLSVGATYSFPNGFVVAIPTFGFDIPVEIVGKVGDIVSVGAALSVGTDNRAGFHTEVGGGMSSWGGLSETHIDASHTARIFLDPITAGITLVAESGHNYSISAVPEPAAWLTLLAGLATLGVVVRRRNQRAPANARVDAILTNMALA